MTVYTRCVVLQSTYRDSVALMRLSRTIEGLPDVEQAAAMMGTEPNKALLRDAGLLTSEGEGASPSDLIICARARSPGVAEEAIQEARHRLAQRQESAGEARGIAPRTLESALGRMPEANLACISVPGQYAPRETRRALQHSLHVFLFSDHVALDEEEELKALAARQGLLLMGPECGTSIINGAPLGFANQVPRGPVGLISAAGTGLQHVTCLLAHQGIGVSQAIGVGGRDLHQRIGGHSMRAALQALAGDAETRVIVLISKPPDETVAALLLRQAAHAGKPCVLAFLGGQPWTSQTGPVYGVPTLDQAARLAGALARGGGALPSPEDIPAGLGPHLDAARETLQPGQRSVQALYCGGTLAYEALGILRHGLGEVHSNLDGTLGGQEDPGHVVLDMGAEEFTSGRPHPMIDPELRNQLLLRIGRRHEAAVVLLDVMLGWGAHADPAGALVPAWRETQEIARAHGRNLVGIAMVCGTEDDPQGYAGQCRALEEHGFILVQSNAQAARLAAAAVSGRGGAQVSAGPSRTGQLPRSAPSGEAPVPKAPAHLPALFTQGPRVINLGLEFFATQLEACGVPVVHVDWRPPAGGDARLAGLLERLR